MTRKGQADSFSQEYLRSVLDYDPERGLWRWIGREGNARYKRGWFPGSLSAQGHLVINLMNAPRLTQRLAWLWMTGEWPEQDIVHKDGNLANNQWANLALATPGEHEALSEAVLRLHFEYRPSTGEWKRLRPGRKHKVGEWFSPRIGPNGYQVLGFLGKVHYAHRLAWLYMTGKMPTEIDHINGNRADNRWANLRDVTHSQNNMNKSGRENVWWNNQKVRWKAEIQVDKKQIHLGFYLTRDEATAAYHAAVRKYFGKFARD